MVGEAGSAVVLGGDGSGGVGQSRRVHVLSAGAVRAIVHVVHAVRIGRQERRRRRARTPAGIVRTKLHTLKPMAGDNGQDEIVEVLTRARKTLIWERT